MAEVKEVRKIGHDPSKTPSSSVFKTASSLIGLQLLSRLVTFTLNQALVRLVSPAIYGTASIQLEFLLCTILFLSRDGFRNALLRANAEAENGEERSTLASNIALLPVYFGIPVSFIASTLYMLYASEATKIQPHFFSAALLYALAAVLELFSEPMHIKTVQSLNALLRVRAEGLAVIVKSIIIVTVLVCDASSRTPGDYALLAFALGQLSFSAVLFATYALEYGSSITFLIHQKSRRGSEQRVASEGGKNSFVKNYFDEKLLEVSLAMTMQGFVKHVLTEGDKIIISHASPLKDQGGYAVASNYGALIARIVFQPIEETSRLYFSKTLASQNPHATPLLEALPAAISRLVLMLRIYFHFSLLVLGLAHPYLLIVLTVLLPHRYWNTSAPAILSAWVYYIPLLAINGILEAFVASVASSKDLAKQSRWMSGASVAYVLLTIALYRFAGLGDTSVVYANIANLSARIIYCVRYITALVRPARNIGRSEKASSSDGHATNTHLTVGWTARNVLSLRVILCCGLTALVTRASSVLFNIDDAVRQSGREVLLTSACLHHLAIGLVCGLACLATISIVEKDTVADLLFFARPSRQKVD